MIGKAYRSVQTNFRTKAYREAEQKAFLLLLQAHGIPKPECEYQFDPERRWRFDYCWPRGHGPIGGKIGNPIALEQEGGLFIYGGHSRGKAQLANMEKYNTAALLGWRVFRFPPADFKSGAVIPWLKSALGLE